MPKRNGRIYGWARAAGMAVLAAAVAGVCLEIGDLYGRSLDRDRTVVLDPSLFEDKSKAPLRIDGLTRRHVELPVWVAAPLDPDTLLLAAEPDRESSPAGAGGSDGSETGGILALSLGGNRTKSIVEDPNVGDMAVSPDGTKLVYYTVRDDEQKAVWYDLEEERELNRLDGWGVWPVMLDGRRVLEMDGSEFRIRDLSTGDSRVVAAADLFDNPAAIKRLKNGTLVKPAMMEVSQDRKRLFLLLFHAGSGDLESVLAVDLNTGASTESAPGVIREYAPFEDGKLLVSGSWNGTDGLYVLDGSDRPKLLAEGSFSLLSYLPGRHLLAYVAQTVDGRSKLMTAKLAEDKLTDEFTIYGDPGYVRSLLWSAGGESLFCVVDGRTGSDVYQFRLSF